MTLGPHSCRATTEGAKQQLPLLVGRDIYFIIPAPHSHFPYLGQFDSFVILVPWRAFGFSFSLKTILTQHFRAKAVLLVGGNKGRRLEKGGLLLEKVGEHVLAFAFCLLVCLKFK